MLINSLSHVPEYSSCHVSFTAWEFTTHLSPAVHLTLLQTDIKKCSPPASKQSTHLLEILLDKQWSLS